jgi:hypothetical protein
LAPKYSHLADNCCGSPQYDNTYQYFIVFIGLQARRATACAKFRVAIIQYMHYCTRAKRYTDTSGMASLLLEQLASKSAVDGAIRGTKDRVLVLRFGRASDVVCLQQDNIVRREFALKSGHSS